jgi:RNA polymerase sigma-70 factor, ECF subfamily
MSEERIPVTDEQLVSWLPKIRHAALKITRGVDYEEIYSNSVHRILEKRELINSTKQIWPVVKSRSINEYRRYGSRFVPADPNSFEIEDCNDPFKKLHFKEVMSAIGTLPEKFQTVLKLAAEGLKYDEMSAILNVPVGTVRSRLSRARIALREMTE